MTATLGLIPLLPLAGAAVLFLSGRALRRASGLVATATVAASLALSAGLFLELVGRPPGVRRLAVVVYEWIAAGGLRVSVELRADPLTLVMLLVVTGVGTLIHWYSTGYMAHDDRRATFFAELNLFVFSMLVLVLANNFLLLYVGWELVGLCSYLLISFWRERPAAAAAAKKAFIVNRIGDLGFLLGILLVYATFGTLDFDPVFAALEEAPLAGAAATAIPLLLFVGAVGKSAQIPLHVWLPDAMEGPTPVSALIHAATMVTAGVYLVARAHPFFEGSEVAAAVVAGTGAATALFAATIAAGEDDLKRVLAYSTISQLGYMFLGAGVGALSGSAVAYAAAVFHLVTHAFFKALLFLGAGSVMHGLGDRTDMKRMGGLLRAMPATGATFAVGWLALAGVAPLSGFFSKDAVIASAFEHGRSLLGTAGLAAALLTAFYASRQFFLTFLGRSRVPEGIHPHESPRSMTIPLGFLAVLTAAGGLLGLGHGLGAMGAFLTPVFGEAEPEASPVLSEGAVAAVSLLVAAAGIALAHHLYLRAGAEGRRAAIAARIPRLVAAVKNRYYVDEAYGAVFVRPARALAGLLAAGVDARGIDRAVAGVGAAVQASAAALRRLQSGLLRRYVLGMLAGIVGLLAVFLARLQ